jgi:Protein of unknown function (DUF2505)
MSSSFDGVTESSASVEQIHSAFGREDYWRARLATGEAATTLDSLTVSADGTVAVRVTQNLGRLLLPRLVAKFVSGEVQLVHSETWTPDGNGQVRGQIRVSVSGGLGSCRAKTWLASAAQGSQMRFAGRVEVKIPLVGGNLEKSFGTNLAENIPTVVDFTTAWIAEQAAG